MLYKQITAAVITAIFTSLASNVHGHGHLVSPRSRNYVANQDGKWWPADETTPYPEDCPHCKFIYAFSPLLIEDLPFSSKSS